MMAFTDDGQLDPALLAARDERYGIDSDARRALRADIASPDVDPAANSWQNGQSHQTQMCGCAFHRPNTNQAEHNE